MEIKRISNKLLVLGLLLAFTATTFFFQSCKKKEHKLDILQEELLSKGYEGSFDRAGRMEKMAIGVFGVKDRLLFHHDNFFATFIELDEEKNFEEIANQILPIISESVEKDEIKSVKDNIFTNENLVMIYHGESPDEEFLEVFKNI